MAPLTIGVIGSTGFSGSYLCVELLRRGSTVIGLSRKPEKLGTHERYIPRPIDVETSSISELAQALHGLDVLVNEYGPHTGGADALQYMPYLEMTRRIVLAAKEARVGYFINLGGAGSLYVPGTDHQSCLENKDWWLAYRRGIADSEAHVSYMEERLGPMGAALRNYRNARISLRQGGETPEVRKVIEEYEEYVRKNDRALAFITACRTSFMFFDGNTSFRWTFVSPSALYRSGARTGKYETIFDVLPLKGDQSKGTDLDGRLHGISAADLAVAIADEAQQQRFQGRHWSAYGDLSDDTPTPSYVTIDSI